MTNPQIIENWLINYNWFPIAADHCLDATSEYYESIGVSKLHDKANFNPEAVEDGDIVFVKTDFIYHGVFQKEFLPKIKNNFTLVSGASAYSVDHAADQILFNNLVKYWFCTNPPKIGYKKIVPLQIGFEEIERDGGDQKILKNHNDHQIKWEDKSDKLYLPYHTVGTNPKRDDQIKYLKSLDYVDIETEKLSFNEYLEKMGRYKFVICLPGAGYDTHRNYESLLVGSVPIMITGPIKKVYDYDKLPSIFLDELSKLTSSLSMYKFLFKPVQNFLKIKFHKERILEYAKH